MNKKRRERINENLAKALEPPKRTIPSPRGLDDLLKDYERISDQKDQIKDQPTSLPATGSLPEKEATAYPENSLPDKGSLPEETRLPATTSLPQENSLPALNSLPLAGSLSGRNILPAPDSLPSHSIWHSVEMVDGYCKLPHAITDGLFKHLDPDERSVYTQLYRLSWGFGRPNCHISLPRLAERSKLGRSTTQRVVERLIKEKGIVIKTGWTVGAGKDQGTEFCLPLPGSLVALNSLPGESRLPKGSRLPAGGSNKDLKKKYLKILSDHRQELVGAGPEETRAVLERECRRQGVGFDLDLFNEIIS